MGASRNNAFFGMMGVIWVQDIYFSVYEAVWKWHKWSMEHLEDKDFWERCVDEARKIQSRFNSEFCNSLIFSEMQEFKRLIEGKAREPCGKLSNTKIYKLSKRKR